MVVLGINCNKNNLYF